MPRSQVYRRGQAELTFNMTPMIDCTFQLILFFLLSTQIASADYVRMQLPAPLASQARELKGEEKVVVNVVPYPDSDIQADPSREGLALQFRAREFRVKPDDVEGLVARLVAAQRRSKDPDAFVVELRADRRIQYNQIEPLLRALQRAELSRLRITALQPAAGES